jgi:hypothetical protein
MAVVALTFKVVDQFDKLGFLALAVSLVRPGR